MLTNPVIEFLDDIARLATAKEVGASLLRFLEQHAGADSAAIQFWGHNGQSFATTYPEWFGPYVEKNCGGFHGWLHLKACHGPIWYGIDLLREDWPEDSKTEARLAFETSGRRVEVGLPVPSEIGLGGAVAFGSREPARAFAERLDAQVSALFLASYLGHLRMQHLYRCEAADAHGMTERESECLLWISRGLHTGQIADKLGIAEVTVHIHIRKAKKKLGTGTRAETVAKAIVLGLIEPWADILT